MDHKEEAIDFTGLPGLARQKRDAMHREMAKRWSDATKPDALKEMIVLAKAHDLDEVRIANFDTKMSVNYEDVLNRSYDGASLHDTLEDRCRNFPGQMRFYISYVESGGLYANWYDGYVALGPFYLASKGAKVALCIVIAILFVFFGGILILSRALAK
jgi:hypothetical protein